MVEKRTLIKKYTHLLVAQIQKKVNDPLQIQLLLNNCFDAVFQSINSYDESKISLSTWVMQKARNVIFKNCSTQQENEICKVIHKLPYKERTIVELYFIRGFSKESISSLLNLSLEELSEIIHSTEPKVLLKKNNFQLG